MMHWKLPESLGWTRRYLGRHTFAPEARESRELVAIKLVAARFPSQASREVTGRRSWRPLSMLIRTWIGFGLAHSSDLFHRHAGYAALDDEGHPRRGLGIEFYQRMAREAISRNEIDLEDVLAEVDDEGALKELQIKFRFESGGARTRSLFDINVKGQFGSPPVSG
jgi:hypothetical protein